MRYELTTNRLNKQTGLTLIELILYIAIISVLGLALVRFSVGVINARNKSFAMEEVQAAGRNAVEFITSRIQAAQSINTASSTFGVDPGVLSLTMSDSSKNPMIIDLSADNGRLRITQGTTSPYLASDNLISISSLIFTDLTSTGQRENVRIQMTVEYNNADDQSFNATQTFQTSASLRQ